MLVLLLQQYICELLLVSAILFDLLFGAHIISEKYWSRPILIKNTYRFYFIVLVFVFFGYLYAYWYPAKVSLAHLTNIAKVIVTIFAIVALVLSNAALKVQKISFPEFFFFFMVATLSALLMLVAPDLLFFYLVLEAQTLCFFVLAVANRKEIYSNTAGLLYYLIGSYSSVTLLLGTALIYSVTGTVVLSDLVSLLSVKGGISNGPEMHVFVLGSLLIVGSLLFKVGLFPFHFWLPDVYEGAPLASTIVYSILPKFSLVYFFLKFMASINQDGLFVDIFFIPLLTFGVFSVFVGALYGIRQRRLKRLLIFSSIVQIGFVMVALSTLKYQAAKIAIFFLIIYLITASLLWGVLVLMYKFQQDQFLDKNEEVESMTLDSISNFVFFGSIFAFIFVYVMFQTAGIPPLAAFYTKMNVVTHLIEYGRILESAALIISGYISVYYYINLIKAAFFENAADQKIRSFRSRLHAFLIEDSLVGVNILIFLLLSVSIFCVVCPHAMIKVAELMLIAMFTGH